MAGALKALQANLRHLTWQTQMIARGDFSQRVDFMGEFSESFNTMVLSLAASRDQLLAANQDLEAFSYSVSHDLRAPLRAIEGFSRILLDDQTPRLDAEGRRQLGIIIDNARRMARLIDDLLAFSRLGSQEMQKTDLDLAGLARSITEELQDWTGDRHLEVTFQELPPAYGDPVLLRQVLVNLLSNAIKFTAPRDPGRIEVGGFVDGPESIYYVKDNGVGFDVRDATRIFGVFQKLHPASEFEGSGVGLAIVLKIIHRHGGRVWAEGRVNQGASIYFSLPQAAVYPD
jgi:two-component system sensor kinase